MNKQKFFTELEALVNAPPGCIQENTLIEGLSGWDSLSNTEFRWMVADQLGRELDGLKVDRARTVGDLLALVVDLLED